MIRRNLLWALLGTVAVAPVMAGPVVVIPPRESGDASALMRASQTTPQSRTIAAAPLVGTPSKVVVIPGAARSVPGATVVSSAGFVEKPAPQPINNAVYVNNVSSQVVDVGTTAEGTLGKADFKPIGTLNDNGSVTPIVDTTDADTRAISQLRADNVARENQSQQADAQASDGKATTVGHRTSVSIGIGVGYSAPRYYQSVGYYSPAPVYVAPTYYAPTYYAPTYYAPVYCPPVYSYFPSYSYTRFSYGHYGHHHGHRHHGHGHSGVNFSFRGRF